jgi:hypothetical protein
MAIEIIPDFSLNKNLLKGSKKTIANLLCQFPPN